MTITYHAVTVQDVNWDDGGRDRVRQLSSIPSVCIRNL